MNDCETMLKKATDNFGGYRSACSDEFYLPSVINLFGLNNLTIHSYSRNDAFVL